MFFPIPILLVPESKKNIFALPSDSIRILRSSEPSLITNSELVALITESDERLSSKVDPVDRNTPAELVASKPTAALDFKVWLVLFPLSATLSRVDVSVYEVKKELKFGGVYVNTPVLLLYDNDPLPDADACVTLTPARLIKLESFVSSETFVGSV